MEATTTVDRGRHRLVLRGRFDASTAAQAASHLDHALAEGERELGVDLAGVEFIDSTAISTLVRTMRSCRAMGGDLVLWDVPPGVQVVLELTGLDRAFTTARSTPAAPDGSVA